MRAANMKMPREELILAEMIANAEHHQFGFRRGHTGIKFNVITRRWDADPGSSAPSEACGCAVGAFLLGKTSRLNDEYSSFERRTKSSASNRVIEGNDNEVLDPELQPSRWIDVGAAYRAYHEGAA